MSVPSRTTSRNSEEGKGWKLVTSGTTKKVPAPPEGLQLRNRFIALKVEEELSVLSSKASGLTDPEHHRSTRRKWQVIAVVTPCCRGLRPPTIDLIYHLKKFAACWAPTSGMLWEGCQSLSEPLLTLSLCCSSMWVPMRSSTTGNLKSIRSDYRALGVIVRGMRAQVVFSSVLLVRGKGVRRIGLILHVGCTADIKNRILVSMTMGPCLRINGCLRSTLQSGAKISLPVVWLTF